MDATRGVQRVIAFLHVDAAGSATAVVVGQRRVLAVFPDMH